MAEDSHHAVPVEVPVFGSRRAMYEATLEEIRNQVDKNTNFTAGLSNASSVLFYNLNAFADRDARLQALPVNWCGFYLLQTPQMLGLGPFQGKLACQKIKIGRGVCGTAALTKRDAYVPEVQKVPGHIACDAGSVSEAVVLMKDGAGRVLGLLDIDSTVAGFFGGEETAVDEEFLPQICAYLADALGPKFPMAAPAAPPADAAAVPALSATRLPTHVEAFRVDRASAPGGVPGRVPGPTGVVAPPSLVVRKGPEMAPAKVESDCFVLKEWEFQATQCASMMPGPKMEAWEDALKVKQLPEIIFEDNVLNCCCSLRAQGGTALIGTVRFRVAAYDALRAAAEYYTTPEFAAEKGAVSLPSSEWWAKKRAEMPVHDPAIDWAFRSAFRGTTQFTRMGEGQPAQDIPLLPTTEHAVDYDLLKRHDMPIRFFTSMDLFEDDLHDSGLSAASLKARVMDECLFVLVRHVIRVDGVSLRVRDTRVFHKFSERHVVYEETTKALVLQEFLAAHPAADSDAMRRQMADVDACAAHMTTVASQTFVAKFPDA